jgi:pimeloyl-ACP methyl ester carboxylesterase
MRRWALYVFAACGLLLGVALLAIPSCDFIAINRRLTLRKIERAGFVGETRELSSGAMRTIIGGRGSTVLLVHGFGGSALETWEHQLVHLVRSFRVIAPDLYWFGGSTPRVREGASRRFDSAAEQADAIAELLVQLGVARTDVVGISFGGFVALELARRHGSLVGKLVLVDSAGLQMTREEQRAISVSFGDPPELADILIPKDVDGAKMFLGRVFHRRRWIPRFVLRQVLEREFWHNKEAKRRILQRLTADLLSPSQVAEVRFETLVLWGRHDPLIPPSVGDRLARTLPRAKLVYLEQSAHAPTMEEPERATQLILRFLRGE